MGRKQNATEKKDAPKEAKEEPKEVEKKEEEAPEEPPIVKSLKEVDDKYLALEKEFDREVDKLKKAYEAKQAPFLEERRKMLADAVKYTELVEEANVSGTPALPRFWCEALKNHPAFEDEIQKWDEPVLEYLVDITNTYFDADDPRKGFKITFLFAENPYFTNTELCKEFHTEVGSPYTGETVCKEVKSTVIYWKPGKDVTVEKTTKKVKGGGAKKSKQKGKETIEKRDSFFRSVLMSLKKGDSVPDDARPQDMESDDELDDDEMMEYFLENHLEVGQAVQDTIIPFAVRWFTGEADPRDDDDEDDEDEEEEDDDDDDDEDSDDDEEPAPAKKGAAKKGAKKSPKMSPKPSPSSKPAQDPKQEECKQQ